jgi:hypothetical protein
MEFVLAFQQPPNSYEIHADPLKGQQVSLAWKQYMGAMAAAGQQIMSLALCKFPTQLRSFR